MMIKNEQLLKQLKKENKQLLNERQKVKEVSWTRI